MNDQHVVVTGANRGIGKAIAQRFLAGGWHVWALVRNPDSVKEFGASDRVHAVAFDAESEASVLAAAETVLKGAPRVDVLVNNAGISSANPISKVTTADFAKVMAINVTAPFLLCRAFLPVMAKAGGGRCINIASTAGLSGMKYTSAYCASKHALMGLTRSLAKEFASKQVLVTAVCPGWTDTDMLQASVSNITKSTGRSNDDAREQLSKMTATGRFVKPEDVGELTFFLGTTEAAKSITGTHYVIDGGEA